MGKVREEDEGVVWNDQRVWELPSSGVTACIMKGVNGYTAAVSEENISLFVVCAPGRNRTQ